ncbi:MAG: hypothetical protein K0R65_50 [Crocinitomicaceae bacterium]|jgi:hypothetical protein|nr:hypothetical protein [Crocinitomicaceae bacterium]
MPAKTIFTPNKLKKMKHYLLALFLLILSSFQAQTMPKTQKSLAVFLDCSNGGECFLDFIRQELNILTFVRDRTDADVQVLIANQYNSNGGAVSNLMLIGRKHFEPLSDTVSYYIDPNLTEDEKRHLLATQLKSALFPFLKLTDIGKDIQIILPSREGAVSDSLVKDPWNYWVFQLGVNGYSDGNENYFNMSGSGYFSMNRETEKSRTGVYFNVNASRQEYKDNGETYSYDFKNYYGELNHAVKLNQHFAAGISSFYTNSLYSNYRHRISVQPRFEYSIFPYKDFTTKRLILGVDIGPQYQEYIDTTIYLKDKELLMQQSFSLISSFTKPWGSINVGFFWSNYFHDFSKNQFSVNGAISTRLFKGLNLAIWGNYSFVHDQINIRKGDISVDQLLVKNKELLSSYNFNIGMGLSYRFGSKNNNQVFPSFKGLSYSVNL